MPNWHIFVTLLNGLITPLIAQMQTMIGGVCTTMQPIAIAMLLVWLAFVAFDISKSRSENLLLCNLSVRNILTDLL